jgi:hypothetical protein
MAVGSALGSPVALSLAALVGCWAASRRGGIGIGAGLLAGVAVALDHRAALVVPFLLLAPESRLAVRRGLAPAVGSYLLLVAPVAFLDPAAFVVRLAERTATGPGLGLFNLLAYRGAEASAGALALAAVAPLLLVGSCLAAERPWLPLSPGSRASRVVLAPALSPEVAVPLLPSGPRGNGGGSLRQRTTDRRT